MSRSTFILGALLVGLFVCPLFGQSLTTTFANNNGQSGNMFDIVALNDVAIQNFDCNLDTGSWTVEVYAVTAGGTFTGNETNAAAWSLIGTATVTGAGAGVPTDLGLSLAYWVSAGSTQGFYVTCSTGTGMNYTNGTTQGAVFASDSNIQFLEGVGKAYPFGSTFTPRVWNGNIHYTTGPASEPLLGVTTGVGDLVLSGPDDPPGTVEGYLLLSNDVSGPVGGGPFVGLYPDQLTFTGLTIGAAVGNLFHYLPSPATFPNVDLVLPAGSLPTGISYDAVLVQVVGAALEISNVARVNF